jgi:hypothetical protein
LFNAGFRDDISAISWRPVLVVEEAGVPGGNHRLTGFFFFYSKILKQFLKLGQLKTEAVEALYRFFLNLFSLKTTFISGTSGPRWINELGHWI